MKNKKINQVDPRIREKARELLYYCINADGSLNSLALGQAKRMLNEYSEQIFSKCIDCVWMKNNITIYSCPTKGCLKDVI